MGSSSRKDRGSSGRSTTTSTTTTSRTRNKASSAKSRKIDDPGSRETQGGTRFAMNKVSFPEYLEIPRDPDDYRYTYSFDTISADTLSDVKDFFDEYGFVVLRNVLMEDDCASTLDSVWKTLESEVIGFDRDDFSTWEKWHSPFGLPGRAPRFEAQLLKNRQSEKLYQLCSTVMNDRDTLISQDRWTLYRPNGDGNLQNTSWQTRTNVHLDLNPWRFKNNDDETTNMLSNLTYKDTSDFIRENNLVTENMGTVVQGLINICDNVEDDGGLIIIPGFHNHFDKWLDSLGSEMTSPDVGSYKFDAYPKAMALAQRVTMRAGSAVVWDQRCAHGSKDNKSDRIRVAQFFKSTPAKAMSKNQLNNRSKAVEKVLRDHDFSSKVSPVGKIVFGLNHIKPGKGNISTRQFRHEKPTLNDIARLPESDTEKTT